MMRIFRACEVNNTVSPWYLINFTYSRKKPSAAKRAFSEKTFFTLLQWWGNPDNQKSLLKFRSNTPLGTALERIHEATTQNMTRRLPKTFKFWNDC
jgi:hypothetical protein